MAKQSIQDLMAAADRLRAEFESTAKRLTMLESEIRSHLPAHVAQQQQQPQPPAPPETPETPEAENPQG